MFWKTRVVPATQFAKDYSAGVVERAELLLKHIADLSSDQASSPVAHRRKEVCAMVWATIVAAFEVSDFDKADQDKLVPLVLQIVLPHWQTHFVSESEMRDFLSKRIFAYLGDKHPNNPLEAASAMIQELSTAIGASSHMAQGFGLILTPLIAQHILSDTKLFNRIKRDCRIA